MYYTLWCDKVNVNETIKRKRWRHITEPGSSRLFAAVNRDYIVLPSGELKHERGLFLVEIIYYSRKMYTSYC